MIDESVLLRNSSSIKGVGEKRAVILHKKGIETVWKLLCTPPLRLEDKRKISIPNEIKNDENALIAGRITHSEIINSSRRRRFLSIDIDSFNTTIQLIFFNGNLWSFKYLLKPGQFIIAYGTVKKEYKIQMVHPNFKIVTEDQIKDYKGEISPIYSKGMQFMTIIIPDLLNTLKKTMSKDFDFLPDKYLIKYNLPNMMQTWNMLHAPILDNLNEAKRRLKHNELLFFLVKKEIFAKILKNRKSDPIHAFNIIEKLQLPFELTNDQKKAISDISKLLNSKKPMLHLLQGEVGSGKTVVALAAALSAAENGYQTAFMAPTDILSQQHFQSIIPITKTLKLKTVLLTGKQKIKIQNETRAMIKSGVADIIIGTHSLISEKTEFKRLGLTIVDEQQRFGVNQREALMDKSKSAHMIMMTATPIPRTLLMTFYKELTISTLKEMPIGRKPIKSRIVMPENRGKMFQFIKKHIEQGELCYVVLPLIDESEKLNLKNVKNEYEQLTKIFNCRIGMMHGQMDMEERKKIMDAFRTRKISIIVATTVIEVGIDIPDATIMCIEEADRFGMSQIHQLRGRVGRGSKQSYCFMAITNNVSKTAIRRLEFLENHNDGFLISQEDLKIRGPGQFIGQEQSGFDGLHSIDWSKDMQLIKMIDRELKSGLINIADAAKFAVL